MTNDIFMGLAALVLIIGSGILWFRAANAVRLPENRASYVALWCVGVVLAGLSLAEHGVRFESSALTGQPLLFKFFRGHW